MFSRGPQLRWQKLIPIRRHSEVKTNVKIFKIKARVYMKFFKNDKWQSAEIYKILGVNLYLVKSNDKIYKRHANQLTDNQRGRQ